MNGQEIKKIRKTNQKQVVQVFQNYLDEGFDVRQKIIDPYTISNYTLGKIKRAQSAIKQINENDPGTIVHGKSYPEAPANVKQKIQEMTTNEN